MDLGSEPSGVAGAGDGDRARRVLVLSVATAVAAAVLAGAARWFGVQSRRFAFVLVWAPMTWLGTISRVVTPRLPARVHELRPFERDGARLYELLGVRLVKTLLRRGPIAVFNPHLHLPAEPTAERVAELDQRMRTAEASHGILFVATMGLTAVARISGWRSSARWMLASNVALNGYPVLLQRYNRALLARRFDPTGSTEPGVPRVVGGARSG